MLISGKVQMQLLVLVMRVDKRTVDGDDDDDAADDDDDDQQDDAEYDGGDYDDGDHGAHDDAGEDDRNGDLGHDSKYLVKIQILVAKDCFVVLASLSNAPREFQCRT